MKNILYLLLFCSQFLLAQNAFDAGNKFYQAANYTEAIDAYEGFLRKGQESPELYFNLGNSYYKLNQVAPAIYNLEKALALCPNDIEIQNNLAFAQKMTIDDIVEVPKVGFSKIIQDFTSIFHFETWAWITVLFSFLILGCFLGYYLYQNTTVKRTFFTAILLFLLLMIISLFAGFYEKSNYQNTKPAIVFAKFVSVKSEPNTAASDAFVLHAGTKVFVLETLNNFKKIQLLDLKQGWIESTAIKELK
jgi:tetratricopeptide (TPR) repeat protein